TGLPAGLITCYVTDANGCTDSVSFTITEPDMIDTTITQNSAQLTANQEGATYQWYQCPNTLLNGETNQSFEATEIGDYKVEITVGSCVETSACVTVSTLTVKPTEAISKFLMYPNPSSGSFHIQSALEGDFYVVNLLGQVVKTFDVEANIMKTITVNDLQNGIYFVKHRITNQSQKLIIKN
ncbi:MAG: T9SS type A sorting domain-containing protein, partial [Xanthomarina gelatinilytica]|nr:T9SS type A sorting domain-containing protein [Xanthomarina gelatinilytica]